jgi:putative heme transporter
MPTSRGLPQDLKKEDNCSRSGRKQPANAPMRRSHRAQPTEDKCPNGPTVGESTAARVTEADLTLGGRAARWRRARALALVAVALAGLVGLGWLERASVRHSFTVLGHARLSLIPLAIAAEVLSMATLARLQRRLLRAGGVQLPITSMVAIIYASNAISVSIPLAGSPMSAAFSFRSFARRGADRSLAGWALVISGVISTVTFALIVALGAMLSGNAVAAVVGALAALATVVPVVASLIALRHDRLRARLESVVARSLRLSQRLIHRPHGDARALIDAAAARIAGLRLKRRGWAFVFFMATLNWAANIACLALALLAVRSPVPWSRLILAWSAGVGASSFGITPGGLGLVEAVLAGALIAAGVHTPQAVAAVLLYRLISFWLVDALGWTFYVTTRKQGPPPPPVSDSPVDLNP